VADIPPAKESVTFEEFATLDLRVARVLHAEDVAEAAKLLRLEVDLGPLGRRTLFAGLKGHYDPAALVGTLIVVVANLRPRPMRFGTSEAMLLAASAPDGRPFLVRPESGAQPGDRVR
jgi:methionyl-tRNA synthetase